MILKKKTPPHCHKTYISLFSSAGVGCYGFQLEGFSCIATVELLAQRMAVQKANNKCHYESGYIVGDLLVESTKEKIFKEINLWQNFCGLQQVDVVFATPPCQGISTLNYKKTSEEQKRNSLVVEAIKLVNEIKPKIFVFENVRGFLRTTCTNVDGQDMPIEESIEKNLSNEYNIYSKVINFKDYGVPSSRPRTLVIGTQKKLFHIAPLNLFPTRKAEIPLKESIGKFKSLNYGEIDSSDVLHFARKYPPYQEEWISQLQEGQSAFDKESDIKPYKIDKEGNYVALKCGHMGNKYRRLSWDKPGACVSTRNDQLASQDTIHPCDNRVLSIRELMTLMTVPKSFKWTAEDDTLSIDTIEKYLRNHELNIRRCLGEAVPTEIIQSIAHNCRKLLDFQNFVETYNPQHHEQYLLDKKIVTNFYSYTFVKEQMVENAKATGAFYTPQSVVFDALKKLSSTKDTIKILEPAVGLGAFLPQIAALFSEKQRVDIDAIDISNDTLVDLQKAVQLLHLGDNIHINFIQSDFLTFQPSYPYDFVITNPPYAKYKHKVLCLTQGQHKTKNLFALFMLKFKDYATEIVCVIPKNFAIADEYYSVRKEYEKFGIVRICDFGVKFFKKVFVEIMSIHFSTTYKGETEVVDYIQHEILRQPQGYIYHEKLWLLYRNQWFDHYIQTLQLDVFLVFRDRQITNSHAKETGKIRLLRSKNILDNGEIISIKGYDKYIDSIENFAIGKFLNTKALIMPNFTYNTRATFLPDGALPNGSIAILLPKKEQLDIDLSIYASADFRKYYSIIKSRSKFTLNIDNSSIYYIGIPNYGK